MHGGSLGRHRDPPDSERHALEADALARPTLGDAMISFVTISFLLGCGLGIAAIFLAAHEETKP